MAIKELQDKFDVLKPPVAPTTGVSRVTSRDILPTAIADRLLRAVYTKEVHVQGHPQWDNSWTVNSTYTGVVGSGRIIDFDKYRDHEYYFELSGKTDAGTGYWQLLNETDNEVIAGSEISTTSTDIVTLRTGSLPKYSGQKQIAIQHKIVGGDGVTEFVNTVMSSHIFSLP